MALTDPPVSKDIKSLVETRLNEVRKGTGVQETVRIEWRGQPRNLEVIDMPVEMLYYNPETHRIRAQRDHDPIRDAKLAADPWGQDSQDYLHALLMAKPDDPDREDPGFAALLEDLDSYGQKDAGIITPTGVIVNGNTRRAVLKQLGRPHIRVGVLPADYSWSDIGAVELELQLRKENRREYSYINRLIAIGEQIADGRSMGELAKDFRTTPKSVERDAWILAFINEAADRSRVHLDDGSIASLRLMDFEGHQETLKELYRRYMATSDSSSAEALKENRLMAIVLDKAKTDIRWIEEDFNKNYLRPRLNEELKDESAPSTAVSIPGLDFSVPGPDVEVQQARATTDRLLKAKAKAAFAAKLTPQESNSANVVIAAASEAIDDSLYSAEKDIKRRKRKLAAPDKLSEATDLIKTCIDDIAQARSQNLLDNDALDDALTGLRDTLRRLAQQASRGIETPGEGLGWLQHAVTDER